MVERGIFCDGASELCLRRGRAIWLRFEGANPSPLIEARGELAGTHNFFLGNDPAKWRAEVPAFEEVTYRELWPGVDLVWRIDRGELSYEAIPHPLR